MLITSNPVIDTASEQQPNIYYLDDGVAFFKCIGNPENNIIANLGSIATSTDGNVYYKTTSGSNTGWVALGGGGGGTPALNNGELAFGDVSNLMTSSTKLTWDNTTSTLKVGVIGQTSKLRLYNTNGRYVELTTGTMSNNRSFTLPVTVGNAGQAIITDGFGVLSFADFLPATPPGNNKEVIFNDNGIFNASSKFLWDDDNRRIELVTGSSNSEIYFNTSVSTSRIRFQSSAGIAGNQGGIIYPYIGGDQKSGHGLWWSDGTYHNTSRFNLQLGFTFQGASSSTSPVKIRKATGTSADGNIVFAFYPDSGFFDLQPYGLSNGETTAIRFSELTANGTNYIEFKAPDALTGNTTLTLPNGAGTNGQVLTTNGSNTLSWSTVSSGLTIGTTTITSGTVGKLLYDATGGVLGEVAQSKIDGATGQVILGTLSIPPATSRRLVIGGTGAVYTTLQSENDGDRYITFNASNSNERGNIVYRTATGLEVNADSASLGASLILSSNAEGIRIISGGLVGVNKTSSIGAQLHVVSGSSSRVGFRVDSAASPSVAVADFTVNNYNVFSIRKDGWYTGNSASGGGFDTWFYNIPYTSGFGLGQGNWNGDQCALTIISTTSPAFKLGSSGVVGWSSTSYGTSSSINASDLILRRSAAAILQLGTDAAAPITQSIKSHNGVGTDIAGAVFNVNPGIGTGAGIPGTLGIQFARGDSSGSSLNTLSDEWRVSYSNTDTVTLSANIKTSTTPLTNAGAINVLWTTPTHASRTSKFSFSLVGNASALTAIAEFDMDTTAGNTRFLLYDVDTGSLKRVSVGANDSGGTGFKLLRVTN